MIAPQPGQFTLHSLFQFALEEVGNIRPERLISGPEKTNTGAISRKRTALHEINKCRSLASSSLQFINNTTQGRTPTNTGKILYVITTLTLKTIVATRTTDE